MGKWTRRGFITAGVVAGGGLAVGVALRPGHRVPELSGFVTEAGEHLVNAWVKIGSDNAITAIVPHSEMGQGAQTALTQMLAEELDAAWDDISFIEAPAEAEYANYPLARGFVAGDVDIPEVLSPTVNGLFYQVSKQMGLQITGGSASVRATGVFGMRVAGAAAREMLLTVAADRWQVPLGELQAEASHITHAASGRSAPFAEFAAAAGELTPPSDPTLKTRDQFKVMGKSVPRRDIPSKVDGTAEFGIDADVPGMKYATIQRVPVFGGTVKSVDDSAARSMPGVVDVVALDNAVAVVADGFWQAKQALAAVKVTWDHGGNEEVSLASVYQQFTRDLTSQETDFGDDISEGDALARIGTAGSVVSAEYRVPYLAHAPMEPLNATARLEDGRCEVWTGCQNPLGFKMAIAEALELDSENVTLHNAFMGGGFGRRALPDYAIQAAELAKITGYPIKLIWTREEDIRQDHYRPAIASRFRAVLDESNGLPVAWANEYVDKHEPAEAPLIPYAVPAQSIRHAASPTHVPFGPWRSVDHSQHGFFTESFIDELAVIAGKDPYQYRRDLLADQPRHLKVLDLAASKAGWQPRTEPAGGGRGRGISLQQSFGTLVAQVVDVTVNDGNVSVDRVICAVDPGFAVSPDGLTAQMESGIIYGLTAALYGTISLEQGAVVQSNFHDYPMVRMDESPTIETYIIESGERWGGAGEPGTPGIAPALTAAIYQATGTRVRELPVSINDLKYRVTEPDEVV